MSADLKPCPFCGNAATLTRIADDDECSFVMCPTCGACCGNRDTLPDADCVDAWNRRAEVERLSVPAAQPVPLTHDQLRAEFAKLYPNDIGLLELAENNRDFAVEAIGARHHWRAFELGARAVERAHGIGGQS